MPFSLFPSVDEDFNFPLEVRLQLAKSDELKHLVIPMSTSVRDELTEEELWNGRTIYNTSLKKLQTYSTSSDSWSGYLDDTYVFPQPPPFWDEDYNLPEEVGDQLAKHEALRGLIQPFTTIERNALPSSELWNGRLIYNTTTSKLETYNTSTASWRTNLDEDFVLTPALLTQFSEDYRFKHYIRPMTEEQRDALSSYARWGGMTIYNTTTKQLETYADAPENYWKPVLDNESSLALGVVTPMSQAERDALVTTDPHPDIWIGRTIYNTTTQKIEVLQDFTPTTKTWDALRYESEDPSVWQTFIPELFALETGSIIGWDSTGRYIKEQNKYTFNFTFTFRETPYGPGPWFLLPYQFFYMSVPGADQWTLLDSDAVGTFVLENTVNSLKTKLLGTLVPNTEDGGQFLRFSLFSVDEGFQTAPFVSASWPFVITANSRIIGQITYFIND